MRRQAGWLPGAGRLEGQLGSLLIGYYDVNNDLRFASSVGSGLSDARLDELEAHADSIELLVWQELANRRAKLN